MDHEPELEWGNLLVILRMLRGWSQEELAAAAGVSVSAITRQERGIIQKPAVRDKLLTALGLAGRDRELQLLFGAIRASMVGRAHSRGIDEPASLAAMITRVSLQQGVAEILAMNASPEASRNTERLDLGLDELRRERQARERERRERGREPVQ